jgi:hypothetical protein
MRIPSLTNLCLNFPIVLLINAWLVFCLVLLIAEFRVWNIHLGEVIRETIQSGYSYPLTLARRARSAILFFNIAVVHWNKGVVR